MKKILEANSSIDAADNALTIASAVGLGGYSVKIPDLPNLSPFWIDGKLLVLVTSKTTTKAETDAVAEAEKKGISIAVVDYDAKNNIVKSVEPYVNKQYKPTPKSIIKNALNSQNLADITVVVGGTTKKMSELTPVDLKELEAMVKNLGATVQANRKQAEDLANKMTATLK